MNHDKCVPQAPVLLSRVDTRQAVQPAPHWEDVPPPGLQSPAQSPSSQCQRSINESICNPCLLQSKATCLFQTQGPHNQCGTPKYACRYYDSDYDSVVAACHRHLTTSATLGPITPTEIAGPVSVGPDHSASYGRSLLKPLVISAWLLPHTSQSPGGKGIKTC